MNENTSPEEKLFKIIQQEKRSSPGERNSTQKKGALSWLKAPGQALFLWKDKVVSLVKSSVKNTGVALPKELPEIQLATVNISLSIALFFLMVFVAYYAAAKYPNLAKITSAAAKVQSSSPAVITKEIEELQSVNYYTEGPRRRDIFSSTQRPAVALPKTTVSEGGKGAAGDLKLQGIAWSDGPKALIQAGRDGKLFVVKENQAVGMTGIKVKKIFRNKVILTNGESDFEL